MAQVHTRHRGPRGRWCWTWLLLRGGGIECHFLDELVSLLFFTVELRQINWSSAHANAHPLYRIYGDSLPRWTINFRTYGLTLTPGNHYYVQQGKQPVMLLNKDGGTGQAVSGRLPPPLHGLSVCRHWSATRGDRAAALAVRTLIKGNHTDCHARRCCSRCLACAVRRSRARRTPHPYA